MVIVYCVPSTVTIDREIISYLTWKRPGRGNCRNVVIFLDPGRSETILEAKYVGDRLSVSGRGPVTGNSFSSL